ncbi:MAG: Rne/Rng family ribonuclease, partial [Gammaproteobacteria bacterium]|nr:Rne/Rng family ribonuclease [Gammaproteobacteria bacterium]
PRPIEEVLREGDRLLVQIIKEPLGSKGARLTTQISIPSRYLVLMPNSHTLGVSQRIEDEDERQRLREIVLAANPHLQSAEENGEHPAGADIPESGFIVRTAADGARQHDMEMDIKYLQRLWDQLQDTIATSQPPAVIYDDLPLALRVIRDLSNPDTEKIRIDSRETYQRAREFADKFIPELGERIEHYPGERPILDLYSTEDEIQRALQPQVNLKSGGHLVIDQTEAMTTIDVNTGGFVGHRNLDETIFKTNLEAAQAIARQLRLRNLGGIIIIDFIDMTDPEHQRQVLRALEKSVDRDHSKNLISEVTSLGLVQMTRKRTRESLEHVLCESCPTCGGRGSVRTVETVCFEIFREILREARQFEAKKLLVVASPSVVDRLVEDESPALAELEEFIGIPIRFQVEENYTQEQFDVVLL